MVNLPVIDFIIPNTFELVFVVSVFMICWGFFKYRSFLKLKETFLDVVLNNVPTCIFIKDAPDNYLFVNKSYSTFVVRYKEDEKIWDRKPRWYSYELEVLQTGKERDYRHDYKTVDGKDVYLDIKLLRFTLPNGKYAIMGTMTDVTQIVNYVDEIRTSEEKYRNLVEQTHDIIYSLNLDMEFEYCSPRTKHVLGYECAAMKNAHLSKFIPNPDLIRIISKLKTMKPFTETSEFKKRDNTYCYMDFSCSPVFENGMHIGWGGVARDVTATKLMQRELYNKERILSAVSVGIQALMQSMDTQTGIRTLLEVLGNAIGVDRVYLLQVHSDIENAMCLGPYWSSEYACGPIMSDKECVVFDPIALNNIFRGTVRSINQKDLNTKIFKSCAGSSMDCKSKLAVPIFESCKFWGLICFDSCKDDFAWEDSVKSAITVAASNVGAVITIKSMSDQLTLINKSYKDLLSFVLEEQRKEGDRMEESLREKKLLQFQ